MHPAERGEKLLQAIIEGRDDEATALLKDKVDFTKEMKGDNAIHLAARRGSLKLIKLMKAKGADLNQTNYNGNSAIHYAAKGGHNGLVLYLKENGVDLNTQNNDGDTPLHSAVTSQPMDVIEEFIDMGMKPNLKNKVSGQTPLHQALKFGRQEAMEALLIKGANPQIKDKDGKKAEDVAKSPSIRVSLRMYGALLLAMESGYIKARGLKITADLTSQPYLENRTDVIIESIDVPEKFIPAFYCRREKAENTSVVLPKFAEEQVFSDVFHIRISDTNRDCDAKINLPLYTPPSDKEEMVLRFIGNDADPGHVPGTIMRGQENEDFVLTRVVGTKNDKHYCLLETTLIPETSCVCVVFVRAKQEVNTVSEDAQLIKSEMETDFTMDVPAGAFEGETVLSLKVFETSDDDFIDEKVKEKEAPTVNQDASGDTKQAPNGLLSSVFQINISGQQPKKGVMLQIPMAKGVDNVDDVAIVTADENSIQGTQNALEVVPVKPKLVNCNLIFEVSHFSIFVAAPKIKVAAIEELLILQRQISSARDRRKPASLFAVLRKVEGMKHVVAVECGRSNRSADRRAKWVKKGFEVQDPEESESIMMTPGDTMFVDVQGNACLEDECDARERKLQFSQYKSSKQLYSVLLKNVKTQKEAHGDVIISKKMDNNTLKEVARLKIKLHLPPPPPPTPMTPEDKKRAKKYQPGTSVVEKLKNLFN